MTSPAFAAHAASALEAIYATFGVAATWTPVAGGLPTPCTIVKRSPDDTVSLGAVRDAAQLATNLIAIRTSEVAARPAKGDVVAIDGGDSFRILGRPPSDDFGLQWVCEAAPV